MHRALRFALAPLGLLAFAPLALLGAGADPAAAQVVNRLACPVLPTLMQKYLDDHIHHDASLKGLPERVARVFGERLDPSKVLLTVDEYAALQAKLRAAARDALKGKCDVMDWLRAERLKWHQGLEAYVTARLTDETLAIDRAIELELDSDKRPRPTDSKERSALRDKLIHFQLANLVATGETLPEAKRRLAKRYALATRRISEDTPADLLSALLDSYAAALDPHTSYFSADDLEDFQISMKLSLDGIGAVLSSEDGYTVVREVVAGGAADRQGELKVGDKIIAVSQGPSGEAVDVVDTALRDVVKLIRGERGSVVQLTVLRAGERTQRLLIRITRDKIDLKEQAAKLSWKKIKRGERELNLAVIDLPSFYGGAGEGRNSEDDVRRLVDEAKANKADGLLLDLSRNGGGMLSAAVTISGLFFSTGPVVGVSRPDGMDVLPDQDPATHFGGPLVVLTSRISASASEILAGALQDYHRAVVVGDDHTFGKGTVQNVVPLPPGLGALKVTTGVFYLPGGHSTQVRGVPADVIVPGLFSGETIGEVTQPYALPAHKVPTFGGPVAGFTPVTTATVKALSTRSKARVAASAKFAELSKKVAERAKTVVRIADLLDDAAKQDKDKDKDKDGKADKAEEETPQLLEAVDVLADLVALPGLIRAEAGR